MSRQSRASIHPPTGMTIVERGIDPSDVVGKTAFEFLGHDEAAFSAIEAHRLALTGEATDYE